MASTLTAWGMDVEVPVLEILVSELVTNALLHGDGPIGLRLASDGQSVRLEVTDDGGTATTPHLVDRLADSWGTDHADHATRVWTETRPRTARGLHADDGSR